MSEDFFDNSVFNQIYRGSRPVKRRLVRVSEMSAPRGVRKEAAAAVVTGGSF
jgi:hypothetical protein